MGLTAYKVVYDDGTSNVTSMAEGITLEAAKKYFLGKTFTDEQNGREKKKKAIRVEVANTSFQNGAARAEQEINNKINNSGTTVISFKDPSGQKQFKTIPNSEMVKYDPSTPWKAALKYLEKNYPGSKLISLGAS